MDGEEEHAVKKGLRRTWAHVQGHLMGKEECHIVGENSGLFGEEPGMPSLCVGVRGVTQSRGTRHLGTANKFAAVSVLYVLLLYDIGPRTFRLHRGCRLSTRARRHLRGPRDICVEHG
jgi:hypothetical protein